MNVTQKPSLHQDWIDPHALGIVRALQKKGFTTYLVGGCVRDLLLGIQPKDFDIATTAKPDEVRKIIHRAYVIGKRFRLVLVRRDDSQFEVATFRREMRPDDNPEDQAAGDNLFGTAEEDARRRDFTINGLFYDPVSEEVIDYANGRVDLENGWVRMIGEPGRRLEEDPIRILRALRLKHMINFCLDPDLRQAMQDKGSTLTSTVLPRRREEILKLLRLRHPDLAFREAYDLGILEHLSPTLKRFIDEHGDENFYSHLYEITRYRGDNLNPADLFGMLVRSFVRAFLQANPEHTGRELENHEPLQVWMRDELGMFKFEQALALKAFHIQNLLGRRKDFQRRGERRQNALLINDAFPLALRFAETDFSLSCEDMLYWADKYKKVKVDGENAPVRRRRQRPRRRRKSGNKGAEVRS